MAALTGAPGTSFISISVGGDPALGARAQAHCELRAAEIRRSWHLIPFETDTMSVDPDELEGVHFSVMRLGEQARRCGTRLPKR